MTDLPILCIECLRVCVNDHGNVIREPDYNKVGSNVFRSYSNFNPMPAQFVVNGSHYCMYHALPVYEATPSFIIQETV